MLEAIILGIVQGLTEFIPVSSTGHLVLFHALFGWTGEVDSLTFDVALHFGTTTALIGFFWKDWIEILTRRRKLLYMIIAATVPAGIVGVGFRDVISQALRRLDVIAVMLVLFGVLMLVSERFRAEKKLADLTWRDALLIGLAQAVALIPGVSRAGITITAGLFAGYRRADAARFSFLLSTPAVLGATVLESRGILQGLDANLGVFAVGFISSFIAGLLALVFLMKFLKENPVTAFVYYRFVLAGGIALLLLLGN